MSKDPSLFEGGDANVYAYSDNRPIAAVDPNGLDVRGVDWQAQLYLEEYTPQFLRDPVMGGELGRVLMLITRHGGPRDEAGRA